MFGVYEKRIPWEVVVVQMGWVEAVDRAGKIQAVAALAAAQTAVVDNAASSLSMRLHSEAGHIPS